MPEVRPIDANALIKDIAESIRRADEWEKESYEKKDKYGLKCAIDTRRSLLAMISRVKEAPTIKPEVRRGRWNYRHEDDWCYCTACGTDAEGSDGECLETDYCPHCGADMRDEGADNA